jgi:hypothetical protein
VDLGIRSLIPARELSFVTDDEIAGRLDAIVDRLRVLVTDCETLAAVVRP